MLCYKCLSPLEGDSIHGVHCHCFADWFGVMDEREMRFILTMKTAGNSNDPLAHINSSFFHGKFKKYSARLGERNYIIKVRQEPFAELPAMEYLCNQIACVLQLEIPDFFFIKLEGQVDAFVCKNFMEKHRDANLLHLYRLMGERPFDLENVTEVIRQQTGDEQAAERFVQVCLFDALIGNHDRHGRNLAFIQTPKGKKLAPFYDNPSCLAIEEEWLLGAIHEPCGKIHTAKSAEPKMLDYVKDFQRLGLGHIVEEFAEHLDLPKISSLVAQAFISTARKEAFLTLIKRRAEELQKGMSQNG